MSSSMMRIARWLTGGLMALSVPAWATQVHIAVIDGQDNPSTDAVVTLSGGTNPALLQPSVMYQRERRYVPHVLAVHTGTQVSFPISDNVRHQVYSFSPAKRFDLPLYHGIPADPVTFDRPGVVVLGCNIHDWMVGYIVITDDPWFAVSNEKGEITFDLPPGKYHVSLWHPFAKARQLPHGGDLIVSATAGTARYAIEITPDNEPSEPAPSALEQAFRSAADDAAK
ncbi:methylamine utilization protein [Pseudomonas sp.]|uniref:methylamine utilization protein n=1 Tax=Pseudomonas sp. TaxID=306 RepID=UPI0028B03D0F|nr:methylamine utilization protein [Pseudomonas sp.]